jgi:hypothetical protein
MTNLRAVKKVVTETLSEDFSLRILDVRVDEDEDTDGNRILLIEVIFDGPTTGLDARKISGAVRHLRPRLGKINEFAFPLLSFVSKADVGRATRAS